MTPEETHHAPHENPSRDSASREYSPRDFSANEAAPHLASAGEAASDATPRLAVINETMSQEDKNESVSHLARPNETFSRTDFLREIALQNISTQNNFGGTASTRSAASQDDATFKATFSRGALSSQEASQNATEKTSRVPQSEVSGAPRVLASAHFASLLGALFWPCIFLMALVYAWHPLGGTDDVWAHASVGSWIWQRGEVPAQSLFLWGAAPIPWVWHSWLSQLLFYGLMRLGALFGAGGGPYAIAIFTVVCVALCFALLWRLWKRNAPPGSAFALMFFAAIFAGALRYRPRPELLTALFLVLLMLWLDAWWRNAQQRDNAQQHDNATTREVKTLAASTRSRVWRVLLLCVMFALWSNFHGAVLLGLVLLFATALCDVMQHRADGKSRALCVIALLCAAATLLNPFGAGVVLDSLHSANSGMFSRIDEWKPPLGEPQLFPAIWCEITLIVMATIGWWRNPQRRWAQAAWLLAFFAMFLMQRRHLWLLALVCLAVGAMNARYLDFGVAWRFLQHMSRRSESAPPPTMRVLWRGAVLLGLACGLGATLGAQRSDLFPPRGVRNLPAGAAAFVNAQNLRGRVFNDYENSSYLQWAWNGKNPLRPEENTNHQPSQARRALYIDLLNAYPFELLEEYLLLWRGGAAAQKRFDRRDVKIIVLGDDKRDSGFTKWLNGNPQWRRIYDQKGDGLVWIRAKDAAATRASTRAKKSAPAKPR